MGTQISKFGTIVCAAVLLGVLAMPAHATEAPGAPSLPPFAPWMKLEENLRNKRPEPMNSGLSPRQIAQKSKSRVTPEMPVLTPEDTMAMIDEIYQDAEGNLSGVEDSFSARAGTDLPQFGYDMFAAPRQQTKTKDAKEQSSRTIPAGGVQDNFIVNIGDRLDITFRGQRQDRKTYAIDSQGQLLIDDLPPVSAAGRTIAQLREALQAEAEKLYNTQVFLALESVRQANVLLIGHVEHPGRRTLTAFDTVLDALTDAGGVKKTGSLRQIKLIRDGRSSSIDLYSLLVHGTTIGDISLRDGDRIVIPPLGPTMAVAGSVRRPGIYELLPAADSARGDAQAIDLDDALDLAGGILNPGQNRFIHMKLTQDGREIVTPVTDDQKPVFTDGSILTVAASVEKRTDVVELTGHTRQPGTHALSEAKTLSALINSEKIFGEDIYPLIGVIERRDEKHLSPQMIDFLPLQVVRHKFDRRLQNGDVVHLFSRAQIMELQDDDSESETLAMLNKALRDQSGAEENPDAINDPVMISFLHERNAFIRGAVRNEGAWPVADEATLGDLLAVAGGLTLEASQNDIEVTSRHQGEGPQSGGRSGIQRITVNLKETDPTTVKIGPGDSVRVKQKFQRVAQKSVMIMGEVENPGKYDLMPGERMSELLARVGGLTEVAYPEGAIFSRENERRAEEQRFRAQAQDLEVRLASSLNTAQKDNAPSEQKIEAVQSLITQLKRAKGVGRITVEADPAVLAIQPDLDILLEPGDRIYIPKRPLTVRVAGEVLSPASLQFRKTKSPSDYIREAGGITYDADDDRAFVLYPDGSAQPLASSFWSHSDSMIPPGSTIVVPRDPKPFDFLTTARDVTQILSNLAVTAIFVDDIKDNND